MPLSSATQSKVAIDILNKGLLVNIHLASSRISLEKLGYTVKFQEAVQSSGAVSSTCLFPKGHK